MVDNARRPGPRPARIGWTLVICLLIGCAAAAPAAAGVKEPARPPGFSTSWVVAPAGAVHMFAASGRQVGRFDLGPTGSAHRTPLSRGLHRPRHLTADSRGNLYLIDVLDDGVSRLIWISPAGVQRVLAPNLRDVRALVLDPRGNVVVADGFRVIRITQPAGTQRVLGTIAAARPAYGIDGIGLDAGGRPTASFPSTNLFLAFATFPAAGGRPTFRTVVDSTGLGIPDEGVIQLRETPAGSVLVEDSSFTTGYHFLTRYRAGSIAYEYVPTRTADYAWTFDAAGKLWFMQSRKFCNLHSAGDGSCHSNDAVDHILTGSPEGGAYRAIPTLGLTLPHGGMVVDSTGTTYAAQNDTARPDLVRIAPTGGRARAVAIGSFDSLVLWQEPAAQ